MDLFTNTKKIFPKARKLLKIKKTTSVKIFWQLYSIKLTVLRCRNLVERKSLLNCLYKAYKQSEFTIFDLQLINDKAPKNYVILLFDAMFLNPLVFVHSTISYFKVDIWVLNRKYDSSKK